MTDMIINSSFVPASALYVLAQIQKEGHQAYIVGGSVRDAIMGRAPHDIDISSDRSTGDIMSLFGGENLNRDGQWERQVIPSGVQFGTVTVRVRNINGGEWDEYEITTFRGDGDYSDGRHPGAVVFLKSCEEDLARRDLTINAMAWDPISGRIVDPFGGQRDLINGVIRAVGDARRRFQEDGLRIARAIRFASRFGFSIEPETMEAIKEEEAQKKFDCVSKERQRDEFVKIITSAGAVYGSGAVYGIALMIDTGIMKRMIPEIHFEQFRNLMDIDPDCSKEERIAVLVGEQPQVLRSLKFTRAEVETITKMAKNKEVFKNINTDADIRKAISIVGKELAERMITVSKAVGVDIDGNRVRSILAKNPPVTIKELAVTGRDVSSILGIKPGPEIGKILNKVLDKVIINPELNVQCILENIVRNMD